MKSFISKTLNGSFKYIDLRELGIEQFRECNFMNITNVLVLFYLISEKRDGKEINLLWRKKER